MFKKLGQLIDAELTGMGLNRRDFRIRWTFRGKRYYYETFSAMWWLLVIVGTAAAAFAVWAWLVMSILAFPEA